MLLHENDPQSKVDDPMVLRDFHDKKLTEVKHNANRRFSDYRYRSERLFNRFDTRCLERSTNHTSNDELVFVCWPGNDI